MAPTLTDNSFIKLPEYKVYTEHDLKMLGVYFVHEYRLQDLGFYPLVELQVVVDEPEVYNVASYEYAVVGDAVTASPLFELKDAESVAHILKRKLAQQVANLETHLINHPIFLNRAYRTEFAFSNLCRKTTDSARLLSVYLKITMLLQKDFA